MYLLDTNVVSELRRPRPAEAVVAWLSHIDATAVFLSAVTIGELQIGVEGLRKRDPEAARIIELWVEMMVATYDVLPMDVPTFRCWAQLFLGQPREVIADAMIAATAQVHGLTIATRNVRDFERFGVSIINPFQSP